jgi:hypothetical protein
MSHRYIESAIRDEFKDDTSLQKIAIALLRAASNRERKEIIDELVTKTIDNKEEEE